MVLKSKTNRLSAILGKGYIGGLYMFMSYLHDEEVVRSCFDEPVQYGTVLVEHPLNLLS